MWLVVGFSLSRAPIRGSVLQTAHIQGEVFNYNHSPVFRAEVKFTNNKFRRSVFTDKNGFYETDLPYGLYAMAVTSEGLPEYVRPPFRIVAPVNLNFDVNLDPHVNCEMTTTTAGQAPTDDEALNACGGSAIFSIPSKDNDAFQLSIRFETRRISDHGYDYGSRNIPGAGRIPVTIAYNLFTIRANQVTYDTKSHTLKATGDVIVERADGPTRKVESAIFGFENGEAIVLP
jgi:hypothetical protein